MAQYRVDLTVLPADRDGKQACQFVIFRDGCSVDVQRMPEDPTGHWARCAATLLAREHAKSRNEEIAPDDIEVRHEPHGPIYDIPTPPLR